MKQKNKKKREIIEKQLRYINACFVHFLYTVRSTVSKKYTKPANMQKLRRNAVAEPR